MSRWEDVREFSRDPARYRSGRGVLMDDPVRQGMTLPGSILHMDPPEHAKWRPVASLWFTPRAVAGLEDGVRRHSTAALDELDRATADSRAAGDEGPDLDAGHPGR